MSSDLIEHFKLDAQVHNDHTVHVEPARGMRKAKIEKKWYREKYLGHGAFGDVWLEAQRDADQVTKRAVKLIRKHRMQTVGIDYRRELLALAKLSRYPELFVTLHGWYEDDDNVFLAMEYFQYGDLDAYIDAGISEDGAKLICAQLLDGLSLMHRMGFTHRDLKPQNIFVASPGPNWGVKIGDFGISKRIATEQTALRTQAGTQHFQAPEILGYGDEAAETSEPRALNNFCSGRIQFPSGMLREKGVSADGIYFVEELLNPHPTRRPLADAASQHAWLESSSLMEAGLELDQQDAPGGQDAENLPQSPLPEQKVATEERVVSPQQPQRPGHSNIQIQQSDQLKPSHRHIESEHSDESTTKPAFQVASNAKPVPDDADAMFLLSASQGTPENLRKWWSSGAKLDAREERSRTALHIAVAAGNHENVRWLLGNGVDPSTVDFEGNTALHLACETGQLSTIIPLLPYTTITENFLGNTPLHTASLNGRGAAVHRLLGEGLNVNARNKNGETPLHVAVHCDDGDFVYVIQQLLDAGANSHALDESGMSAEDLARKKNNVPVLDRLANFRSLTSNDSKTVAIRETRAPLVELPGPELQSSRSLGPLKAGEKRICVNPIACPHLYKHHFFSFPDPYAVVTLNGEQTKRTSVIKRTRNPSWRESVHFNATEDSILAIQIYDRNQLYERDMGDMGLMKLRVGRLPGFDTNSMDQRYSQFLKKGTNNPITTGKVDFHVKSIVTTPNS